MGMVTTAKPFLYLARFTKYHVTRKFFIALDPTAAFQHHPNSQLHHQQRRRARHP